MNSNAYHAGYKARQQFDGEVYPEIPFNTGRQAYLRDLWIKGWEAAEKQEAQDRRDYWI